MPVGRRPQPRRRRDRRPRPPMGLREAGQDGWQSAPPGPRPWSDTSRAAAPAQPKTRRSGSWSSGRLRALLPAPGPMRAASCAPFPLARPPCFRAPRVLADSPREPPRGEEGGAAEGGRRPLPAALAVKAGLGSKLSAAALATPGEKGRRGPRRVQSRQPGPVLTCFSSALVSPPTARGRGEGCGCGRRARAARAGGAPLDSLPA